MTNSKPGETMKGSEWLESRIPTSDSRDAEIVEAARRALRHARWMPRDAVRAIVSAGWLTLEGTVPWEFQRRAAFHAVRDLPGVTGISNEIAVEPEVKPQEIRRRIGTAFRRGVEADAERVIVEVTGGHVMLSGTVASLEERDDAERAAWTAGVCSVENRIAVRGRASAWGPLQESAPAHP